MENKKTKSFEVEKKYMRPCHRQGKKKNKRFIWALSKDSPHDLFTFPPSIIEI